MLAWGLSAIIQSSLAARPMIQQGESKSQTEYVAEPNMAAPKPVPIPDESSQLRLAYMRTLNVIEGW